MTINYKQEMAAGWVIFPLNKIIRAAGKVSCGCGDIDCKAIGKHPLASNWQCTQQYDKDQLNFLEDPNNEYFGNCLISSHGVVVATSGLLVVDVDGRNGGFESAKRLQSIRDKCCYIVKTGSGNGEHWYFKVPEEWRGRSLAGTLHDYPGIDFKSTGFVVGVGCEHASGGRYEVLEGEPEDTGEAPSDLLEMLLRPDRERFVYNGSCTDYSTEDLQGMVDAIPNPGKDYDLYLQIGMALHSATKGSGEGYDLWSSWTIKSPLYSESYDHKKWGSFGKNAIEGITVGTLIKLAYDNGWQAPVTFVDNTDWGEIATPEDRPATETSKYNLLQPPGLAGELTQWINSRCIYPREHLAVAAALQIISNAASMNYLVGETNASLNLITICIAGSRTGKGAIKKCINEVNRAIGFSRCEHGKFKSGQELIRNAIDHQLVIYTYDEFGEQLKKLGGAEKAGAHYLVDLIAILMEMYSESTNILSVSGDMKREMVEIAEKRLSFAMKKDGLSDGENPIEYARRYPDSAIAKALMDMHRAENGITEPILTFIGFSEPVSFHDAINKNRSLLSGGFLGRALIFEELETVPVAKEFSQVSKDPAPENVLMKLRALATSGHCETSESGRIERKGDWRNLAFSDEAKSTLSNVKRYWHEVALSERDSGSALESQANGALELTMKVAGILGAASGLVDEEHVGWAHELVKKVTLMKINKAKASDSLDSNLAKDKGRGILLSIMTALINSDKEMTLGVIKQRVPGGKALGDATIQEALDHLFEKGRIKKDTRKGGNGRIFSYYSVAK